MSEIARRNMLNIRQTGPEFFFLYSFDLPKITQLTYN